MNFEPEQYKFLKRNSEPKKSFLNRKPTGATVSWDDSFLQPTIEDIKQYGREAKTLLTEEPTKASLGRRLSLAAAKGGEQSLFGLGKQVATGEPYAEGLGEYEPKGMAERAVSTATTFGLDLPAYLLGGGVGKEIAKTAGKKVLKEAGKTGLKSFLRRVVPQVVEKTAPMGTTFAVPEAAREAEKSLIETEGQPLDVRAAKAAEKTIKGAGKGYTTGSAVGVAGAAPKGLRFLSETAAMANVPTLVSEGRFATPEETLRTAEGLGVLKLGGKAISPQSLETAAKVGKEVGRKFGEERGSFSRNPKDEKKSFLSKTPEITPDVAKPTAEVATGKTIEPPLIPEPVTKNELKQFTKNIRDILNNKKESGIVGKDEQLLQKFITLEKGTEKFGLEHLKKHLQDNNITENDIYRLAELTSTSTIRVKKENQKITYGKPENPLINTMLAIVADNPREAKTITLFRPKTQEKYDRLTQKSQLGGTATSSSGKYGVESPISQTAVGGFSARQAGEILSHNLLNKSSPLKPY